MDIVPVSHYLLQNIWLRYSVNLYTWFSTNLISCSNFRPFHSRKHTWFLNKFLHNTQLGLQILRKMDVRILPWENRCFSNTPMQQVLHKCKLHPSHNAHTLRKKLVGTPNVFETKFFFSLWMRSHKVVKPGYKINHTTGTRLQKYLNVYKHTWAKHSDSQSVIELEQSL